MIGEAQVNCKLLSNRSVFEPKKLSILFGGRVTLRHRVIYQASDSKTLLKVVEEAWKNWVLSKRAESAQPELLTDSGEFVPISSIRKAKREIIETRTFSSARITDVVNQGAGSYSVVITWVNHRDGAWVQVDGNAPDAESPYQPPKISQQLFDAAAKFGLQLYDSSPYIRFSPAPQVIDTNDVETFRYNVLENSNRKSLALVSGTAFGADRTQWREAQETLIYPKVIGMSTLWMLTPEATEAFNSAVPDVYRVFPSSIHAFRPELNLERPSDGVRHRYFPQSQIRDALTDQGSKRYLQNRLYYLARSVSLGLRLPEPLIDADSQFDEDNLKRDAEKLPSPIKRSTYSLQDRLHDAISKRHRLDLAGETSYDSPTIDADKLSQEKVEESTSSSAESTPQPSQEQAWRKKPTPKRTSDYLTVEPQSVPDRDSLVSDTKEPEQSRLQETLDLLLDSTELHQYGVNLSDDGLLVLVELAETGSDAKAQLENLKNKYISEGQKYRQADKDRDDLLRALEDSEARLSELSDQNRLFYKRLAELNAPEEAYSPPPARPDSIIEVLERLSQEFPHIVFTGNRKDAEALDARPNSSNLAQRCWNALQVLEDYATQFEEHGSVERYLRNDRTNQAFAVDHAPTESDSVANNPRFRSERELPVPTQVASSGKIYMEAHFRIGRGGGKAPRMHYYDAMSENRHIYVGYLGAHLRNTMTS